MTVELHTGIEAVINPQTGEVLTLTDASLRDLAAFIEHARSLKVALTEQIAAVGLEITDRLDRQAKWTVQAEEYEIRGESPTRVTYSASKLYEQLQQLVAEDLISEAAAHAACERTYAYAAKPAGVNNLRKLGGAVASTLDACAVPVDPLTRRVSVKRKGYVE